MAVFQGLKHASPPPTSSLVLCPLGSCWGWFLQLSPAAVPQFRYGAHDYYSLDDFGATAEEVVRVSGDYPPHNDTGKLTHETVVVSSIKTGDGTVTFYRDGKLLGVVALPREVPSASRRCVESALERGFSPRHYLALLAPGPAGR